MARDRRSFLLLAPSDKTGGGNRVMFELANALSADHQVTVAFPAGRKGNSFSLSPAVRLRPVGFADNALPVQFFNIALLVLFVHANRSRFDRIIATGQILTPFLPLFPSKSLYNFVQADDIAIFDDRALIKSALVLSLYKTIIKWSYRRRRIYYLFNSRYTHQQFLQNSGRSEAAPALVHPGVDPAIFNANGRTGTGTLRIALMARPHKLKGLDTFLEAFVALNDRIRRSVQVTLITQDPLRGSGLQPEWEVVRPDGDRAIADALRAADIFVAPSWHEGFGLPALEAMACGCAVVTSDNGGCREYAVPGENCLMFDPRDAGGLRDRLARLIGDAELRRRLSRAGIATATRFAWGGAARQLLDIIGQEAHG